jgi:hypothetical protein
MKIFVTDNIAVVSDYVYPGHWVKALCIYPPPRLLSSTASEGDNTNSPHNNAEVRSITFNCCHLLVRCDILTVCCNTFLVEDRAAPCTGECMMARATRRRSKSWWRWHVITTAAFASSSSKPETNLTSHESNDLKWEWQLNRRKKKSNNRDSTSKRCTQSVVLAGPPRPESTIVIVVLWLSVRTWNRTREQDHESDHA